jgi:hypothetical protein
MDRQPLPAVNQDPPVTDEGYIFHERWTHRHMITILGRIGPWHSTM